MPLRMLHRSSEPTSLNSGPPFDEYETDSDISAVARRELMYSETARSLLNLRMRALLQFEHSASTRAGPLLSMDGIDHA